MVKFIKRFLGIHHVKDTMLEGHYPFLVTGCARSGTHFMAEFLKMNGVAVGHESTNREGAVAWLAASDKYCSDIGATFEKKLHLIRNPLNVLSSLKTINSRAWGYVDKYAPQCRGGDELVSAAKYWIEWNKLAEKNAVMTVRLEDFQTSPQKVCENLSVFFDREMSEEKIKLAHERRDSRVNSKAYGTSDDLERLKLKNPDIFQELKQSALGYGYSFPG